MSRRWRRHGRRWRYGARGGWLRCGGSLDRRGSLCHLLARRRAGCAGVRGAGAFGASTVAAEAFGRGVAGGATLGGAAAGGTVGGGALGGALTALTTNGSSTSSAVSSCAGGGGGAVGASCCSASTCSLCSASTCSDADSSACVRPKRFSRKRLNTGNTLHMSGPATGHYGRRMDPWPGDKRPGATLPTMTYHARRKRAAVCPPFACRKATGHARLVAGNPAGEHALPSRH